MIGSAFGLSTTTSVFNSYIRSHLSDLGVSDPLKDLSGGRLDTIPAQLRDQTRRILSDGYNRQMVVLCGFAAGQLLTALLIWRRKQVVTV